MALATEEAIENCNIASSNLVRKQGLQVSSLVSKIYNKYFY